MSGERLAEIDTADRLSQIVIEVDAMRQRIKEAKTPEEIEQASGLLRQKLAATREIVAAQTGPDQVQTLARIDDIAANEARLFAVKSRELELERVLGARTIKLFELATAAEVALGPEVDASYQQFEQSGQGLLSSVDTVMNGLLRRDIGRIRAISDLRASIDLLFGIGMHLSGRSCWNLKPWKT